MADIFASQNFLTMSRSKNTMRVPYKTSLPFGKLVPIGGTPLDVLPGSTVKLDLANITRMLTPVAPIMDDVSMDVYSFYCPYRILFDHTKQFFGENDQVAWTLNTNEELPHIVLKLQGLDGVYTSDPADFKAGSYLYLVHLNASSQIDGILDSVFAGSLFDYFGLPFVYPNVDLVEQLEEFYTEGGAGKVMVSLQAMPFRGVQYIYNEFFRNENVTDPILQLLYDNNDFNINLSEFVLLYTSKADTTNLSYKFWFLPSVARWKDLFTSLNPAPQRGPAVGLPLLQDAKLKVGSDFYGLGGNVKLGSSDIRGDSPGVYQSINTYRAGDQDSTADKANAGLLQLSASYYGTLTGKNVDHTNLLADLSDVTMATVNQIRYAFSTQRYYEKLARSGARYHEYLRVMFGVRPSDATLQRPQFLGGHHEHINVQQVLQTSETDGTPLGSTGAYSLTGFKTHCFTNSFNEFGIIINFACIRKQHTYCQGLDKYWTKRDVFDIYNPTFAHIGEVPVMKNEVYWQPENTDVLGYNEAWYEYRATSAKVCGILNPLAPNNLSSFVLTDVYDSAPTLSDNFIFEDPNGLDRALVAGASYTNQFVADFLFKYTISAVMPVHSTPGLIDHF